MKDYFLGENKEFILGYEVKDGQIIVKYAKNKTISFPHSKEKEIKILNKMKEQVLENKFIFDRKSKEGLSTASFVTSVSGGVASVLGMVMLFSGITTALLVIALICSGICFFGLYSIISYKIDLNDFEKNRLYLDNENNIQNMMIENTKELDKTLVETKEAKLYNELGQPQFTLNTVNQLSLKELKGIIESIDHSSELEVETIDAFQETLEILGRAKKKEKIKRK